jgi:hypothetical protein
MDSTDIVGEVLWYMVFVTPLITIPLSWKYIDGRKIVRVLVGIGLAIVLSFLLGEISLGILFRKGLGPT